MPHRADSDTDLAPAAGAPPERPALRVVAFGVLYFALCRLGDELTATQGDFATFWPASGLLLAVLLLSPGPRWRWYLAAVLAAEVVAGAVVDRRPHLAVAFGLADVVEGVVGAALVRRVAGGRALVRRPLRDTLALVVLGSGLGAALSSLLGTAALLLTYGSPKVAFATNWVQWWAGNALGVLVLAPAILAWNAPSRLWLPWTARRVAEAALLVLGGGLAAYAVFGTGHSLHLERGYLLLPVLGWAAIRFGLRGASLLGAAVAFLSAWSTASGLELVGPPQGPLATRYEVQLLLGVSLTAALLFAAALEERERADAARRQTEALVDAFLVHSPAALFLLDARQRLRAASRSFERMMGRPGPDLLGETPTQALPGAAGQAATAENDHILATGESMRGDLRRAGRTHDVVKFRIPRPGRQPLVGGVAVDVTEQRLATRSLRLAQVALDRNFTAVLFIEPSGLVTYANEAAGRLLERTTAELLGHSLWELDGAFEEAGWGGAWARLRAEGALVLDGRLARPDGRRVEAEVGLTLVAHDGLEVGVYAARDLTERRRAETAQRLASVGTLAAGMAHEINNPLTFVAANLAFALDRVGPLRGDPRAEEVARALEDAEEGTRRVARVVRDLKAVSRVEVEERRPVDVLAEVETALKLAQHELRHRAALVVALGPVPAVRAPEFQLGQVFLNLLVNAGQAVGDAGADRHTVRVTSRTAPDGWAVVEVADDGPGIPEAARARIFEPFFTTKPVGAGTGLGLSVCHGIVTALGGRIEVESVEGQGARFSVHLPPAEGLEAPPAAAPDPGPAPAPAPAPGPARARLLVIDDEPLIGSTIRRLLSAHEVVALSDPRQALARLQAGEAFDLVLCDLMMPQLSGMELWEALSLARPALARRVVFMTGGAFTDRAREFLAQVGQPQLGKPFQPQDLREAVRGWLATPGALAGPGPPG
ncbi:MAG: MASE1 domain-containing protein [Anaeromyxobacter sp.]|nr:MASE1 domain-containing protein [Anaeromyxobacter sp.]